MRNNKIHLLILLLLIIIYFFINTKPSDVVELKSEMSLIKMEIRNLGLSFEQAEMQTYDRNGEFDIGDFYFVNLSSSSDLVGVWVSAEKEIDAICITNFVNEYGQSGKVCIHVIDYTGNATVIKNPGGYIRFLQALQQQKSS